MLRIILISICLSFTASCSISKKLNKNNNINLTNKKTLLDKNNTIDSTLIDKITCDHSCIKQLSPNEVISLLGNPTLINKKHNIEIWQYRKDFTLNIIWGEFASIQNSLSEYSLNQENDSMANKANASIIWLECVTRNKNQCDPNHCFLKLTDFN